MSVPGIVQESLQGEGVEARIGLGGEDELFVTPTRTLIYRGEGLLRDESIEEYSHDAECVRFSEGRRKTRITLEYPIEGDREFTVPGDAADQAFAPLVEGVLTARGVLDDGESVIAAYRFSELTVIVAERRLVKHIGEAVFDEDFEEFRYEDVTDLGFEDGNVSMQIVLTVHGRSERIKAPTDRGPEVRTRLENALWDFYDVTSNEELRAVIGEDDPEGEADAAAANGSDDGDPFGSGLDPLGDGEPTAFTGDDPEPEPEREPDRTAADDGAAGSGSTGSGSAEAGGDRLTAASTDRAEADPEPDARSGAQRATDAGDEFEAAGFEPATSEGALADEVAELRETVERQNELLVKQQRTIEQLIEELSRGR